MTTKPKAAPATEASAPIDVNALVAALAAQVESLKAQLDATLAAKVDTGAKMTTENTAKVFEAIPGTRPSASAAELRTQAYGRDNPTSTEGANIADKPAEVIQVPHTIRAVLPDGTLTDVHTATIEVNRF